MNEQELAIKLGEALRQQASRVLQGETAQWKTLLTEKDVDMHIHFDGDAITMTPIVTIVEPEKPKKEKPKPTVAPQPEPEEAKDTVRNLTEYRTGDNYP